MMQTQSEQVTTDQILDSRRHTCACCGKEFYIPIYCSTRNWCYKLLKPAAGQKKQKQL